MKLTLRQIAEANHRATCQMTSVITGARQVVEDAFQEDRLLISQCLVCYYLRKGRIVGQAFTKWQCAGCETWTTHYNTGTPELCIECARKYDLCTL